MARTLSSKHYKPAKAGCAKLLQRSLLTDFQLPNRAWSPTFARERFRHESLDVTLAYLKAKDADPQEAQVPANSVELVDGRSESKTCANYRLFGCFACGSVFESFESIRSHENHTKQLHSVLLQYSSTDQEHRGHYKKVPNHVEAFGPDGKSLGIVFESAAPFETPAG